MSQVCAICVGRAIICKFKQSQCCHLCASHVMRRRRETRHECSRSFFGVPILRRADDWSNRAYRAAVDSFSRRLQATASQMLFGSSLWGMASSGAVCSVAHIRLSSAVGVSRALSGSTQTASHTSSGRKCTAQKRLRTGQHEKAGNYLQVQ